MCINTEAIKNNIGKFSLAIASIVFMIAAMVCFCMGFWGMDDPFAFGLVSTMMFCASLIFYELYKVCKWKLMINRNKT